MSEWNSSKSIMSISHARAEHYLLVHSKVNKVPRCNSRLTNQHGRYSEPFTTPYTHILRSMCSVEVSPASHGITPVPPYHFILKISTG